MSKIILERLLLRPPRRLSGHGVGQRVGLRPPVPVCPALELSRKRSTRGVPVEGPAGDTASAGLVTTCLRTYTDYPEISHGPDCGLMSQILRGAQAHPDYLEGGGGVRRRRVGKERRDVGPGSSEPKKVQGERGLGPEESRVRPLSTGLRTP